jgi:hypothetical protein
VRVTPVPALRARPHFWGVRFIPPVRTTRTRQHETRAACGTPGDETDSPVPEEDSPPAQVVACPPARAGDSPPAQVAGSPRVPVVDSQPVRAAGYRPVRARATAATHHRCTSSSRSFATTDAPLPQTCSPEHTNSISEDPDAFSCSRASVSLGGLTLPCRGCATDRQLRVSRPAGRAPRTQQPAPQDTRMEDASRKLE